MILQYLASTVNILQHTSIYVQAASSKYPQTIGKLEPTSRESSEV